MVACQSSRCLIRLSQYFFVHSFLYPILEGAIIIDADFRDITEEEAQILDNVVFVVEKLAANSSDIVTALHQHLLGRAIVWTLDCLPQKIKLTGSNLLPTQYVVEHPPYVCIVSAFVLDSEH